MIAVGNQAKLPEIISRSGAKEKGLALYFTGKECGRGHIATRRVKSAMCIDCERYWEKLRPTRIKTQEQKARLAEHSRQYHQRNRKDCLAKMKARNKAYYQANKESIKEAAKKYQQENRAARNSYKSQWQSDRVKSDPNFRAVVVMRKLVSRCIERIQKGRTQNIRTAERLGYTTEQFRQRIESQFTAGMNWANYGDWQIDHIKPIAAFDMASEDDIKSANMLCNLRPMWGHDNIAKGAMWRGVNYRMLPSNSARI